MVRKKDDKNALRYLEETRLIRKPVTRDSEMLQTGITIEKDKTSQGASLEKMRQWAVFS